MVDEGAGSAGASAAPRAAQAQRGVRGAAAWHWAAAALAWLGGVALQLRASVLPADAAGLAAVAAVAAAAAAWGWRRSTRPAPHGGAARACRALAWLALCGGLASLGWASTTWRAVQQQAQTLPAALEGQDIELVGVVDALPRVGPNGVRFALAVESARWRGQAVSVPERVLLGWTRDADPAARAAAVPARPTAAPAAPTPSTAADDTLRAGQRWWLPVRLKRPHAMLNPAGYDGELWLWDQGAGATGTVRAVRSGPAPRLLDADAGRPIERARGALREAIVHAVDEPRVAGLLSALVVGDQAALEREDWDVFRLTGVAHLVSISGVHVTMFAWLAGLVVGALWRRSATLMHALPTPLAARWGGLAAATGYALLAGWGVPAERTLLMLGTGVALRSLGLRWPWLLVCLVVAVVVTLGDPWALLQAGFWLSFAAVALLMLSEPVARPAARHGWRAAALELLRGQAVATVGLAPLSLVFFQQLSVVGYVANLVSIPLVTLVLTPLALAGVAWHGLWVPAGALARAWMDGLSWLAAWPWAAWSVAAAPPWAAAAGLAGAVLGLAPLPWRLRALAPLLVLPLLWPAVPRPRAGSYALLAADVGQGTAVVVRTRRHVLLYDAGPAWGTAADAGERLLVPLLRARGERELDRLVLSHRDLDHIGGAAAVLRGVTVHAALTSLPADHPLRARGAADAAAAMVQPPGDRSPPRTLEAHQPCQAGIRWRWDGVDFEVLHPEAAALDDRGRSSNSVSCVLVVTDAGGRRALLTGDIEAPQEARLVALLGGGLHAEVLLVPHHGSRTSSTPAFIDAVAPRVAVVQAGYRSRFGHPAPQVVQRYAERGIEVVRSDRCGAWLWHDGAHACLRETARRYWHWLPPDGDAAPADDGEAGAKFAWSPRGAPPR